MAKRTATTSSFYNVLKALPQRFEVATLVAQFDLVSETRVAALAQSISSYISSNLPAAIERRKAGGLPYKPVRPDDISARNGPF